MHHAISFILRIAYACFFGFILLWHTNEIVQYIPQLLGTLLMLESISQLHPALAHQRDCAVYPSVARHPVDARKHQPAA